MNHRKPARWLAVLLGVSASCASPLLAQDLDEHLSFLQPLLGVDWVGGYVGEGSPDLEIVLHFEPILDGNAIRYTREAAGAKFTSETHFFWNATRREVHFLSLNNRGIVEEGVAESEDGKIVLRGESQRADRAVEFETILEIDEQGTLRDTFLRRQDGKWVTGHVQEFVAKDDS
jgi:hypothetical protein